MPELLVVILWYFTEKMKGLTVVIAMLCFGSGVLRLVLQTRQTDVLCGLLSPVLSVLISLIGDSASDLSAHTHTFLY